MHSRCKCLRLIEIIVNFKAILYNVKDNFLPKKYHYFTFLVQYVLKIPRFVIEWRFFPSKVNLM